MFCSRLGVLSGCPFGVGDQTDCISHLVCTHWNTCQQGLAELGGTLQVSHSHNIWGASLLRLPVPLTPSLDDVADVTTLIFHLSVVAHAKSLVPLSDQLTSYESFFLRSGLGVEHSFNHSIPCSALLIVLISSRNGPNGAGD